MFMIAFILLLFINLTSSLPLIRGGDRSPVVTSPSSPILLQSPVDTTLARRGSNVCLTCTFSSTVSILRVEWIRWWNGTLFPHDFDLDSIDPGLYKVFVQRQLDDDGRTGLFLENVTEKESGWYTCLATNSHGRAAGHTHLNVTTLSNKSRSSGITKLENCPHPVSSLNSELTTEVGMSDAAVFEVNRSWMLGYIITFSSFTGLVAQLSWFVWVLRKKLQKVQDKNSSDFLTEGVSNPSYMPMELFTPWEIPRKCITFGSVEEKLGVGQFGVVVRGRLRMGGVDMDVAVKKLKDGFSPQGDADFMEEILLMSKLGKHDNIVKFIGGCTGTPGQILAILEYAKRGSLLQHLKSIRTKEEEEEEENDYLNLPQQASPSLTNAPLLLKRKSESGVEILYKRPAPIPPCASGSNISLEHSGSTLVKSKERLKQSCIGAKQSSMPASLSRPPRRPPPPLPRHPPGSDYLTIIYAEIVSSPALISPLSPYFARSSESLVTMISRSATQQLFFPVLPLSSSDIPLGSSKPETANPTIPDGSLIIMPKGITFEQLVDYAAQVAKGMEYLVSKKVVHRDLAARNILLAEGNQLKIGDFGLARSLENKNHYTIANKFVLPVKWMPPESIFKRICTFKSDVWSFGVVLLEIFSLGKDPCPEIPPHLFAQKLWEGFKFSRPFYADDEIWDMMQQCWQLVPENRPTFTELRRRLEDKMTSMHKEKN